MIYRPSCIVSIKLRVDAYTQDQALANELPRPPTGSTLPSSTKLPSPSLNLQSRMQLNKQRAQIPPDKFAEQLAALNRQRQASQQSTSPSTEPAAVATAPSDVIEFLVIPLDAQITRNAITDATTAQIRFDYRALPVDPRICRAVYVSIMMGTIGVDEYAEGMEGKQQPNGLPTSMLKRNPNQDIDPSSTTRFVGFAESWNIDMGEDGDTVTVACKDLSSLLRDEPLQMGHGVDLTKPIRVGVQELINRYPGAKGMTVTLGTPRAPIPGDGPSPYAGFNPVLRTRKGKVKAPRKGDANQKVWDHIITVTRKLGLVPIFRNFTLYLAYPRDIFKESKNGAGLGTIMVFGRNLTNMTFSRKLVGVKTPTIEVRCPNPAIGRTLWARYPVKSGPKSGVLGLKGSPQPVNTRPNNVQPSGTPSDTVRVYSISGVSDQLTLEVVAQNTFEQLARQEIEGSWSTGDIASFQSEDEADLLDLEPGDTVTVLVAPSPITDDAARTIGSGGSPYQRFTTATIAARTEFLKRNANMTAPTAQKLAEASEKIPLANTFRAGSVNLKWDAEGMNVDCSFYNFIVLREDPALPGSAQTQQAFHDKLAELGY